MYALEYIPFDASALRFAGRITPNISHETRGETEEGGTHPAKKKKNAAVELLRLTD